MNEETEKALQRIKQALARDRMARVVSFPIGRVQSKNKSGSESAEVLSLSDYQSSVADTLSTDEN